MSIDRDTVALVALAVIIMRHGLYEGTDVHVRRAFRYADDFLAESASREAEAQEQQESSS